MSDSILRFSGKTLYLDNFYPCNVEFEGMFYPSSEHAFQAAKTFDIEERKKFQKYSTPKSAKQHGRKVKLRSDWENVKIQVMKDIVKDKFTRNEDIRQLLLATEDAHLEEGNFHGDKFWGTVNREGENWLGKILMEVREELRRQKTLT